MATQKKSFADLLAEAPLSTGTQPLTLIGGLSRSSDDGKFVLHLGDGDTLSLPVEAVQSHTVVGHSFGQQLVQVELDASKLPADVLEQVRKSPETAASTPAAAPFSLQAGHHVPPATLAEMEAAQYAPNIIRTSPYSDNKQPIQDGTYPVYINGRKLWHLDS